MASARRTSPWSPSKKTVKRQSYSVSSQHICTPSPTDRGSTAKCTIKARNLFPVLPSDSNDSLCHEEPINYDVSESKECDDNKENELISEKKMNNIGDVKIVNKRKRSQPDTVEVIDKDPKRPKLLTPKRSNNKDNKEQLHLDLGQKTFGHVLCKICGMLYTYGQPDDQLEHYKFHKKLMNGISFQGWKQERVIELLPDGRILLVLSTDTKRHLKKVNDIRKLIDAELGYALGPVGCSSNLKTFLYISNKKVVGCVMVEHISKGYRVVLNETNKTKSSSWCCSDEPEPAMLGVSRMWVLSSHRRKGIATQLLETARKNFIFGYVVPKSSIAFSDPTPDGKNFATKYCETTNFLVYRWIMS